MPRVSKILDDILIKLEELSIDDFIKGTHLQDRSVRIMRDLEEYGWTPREVAEHYNEYDDFNRIRNCGRKAGSGIIEGLLKYCETLT